MNILTDLPLETCTSTSQALSDKAIESLLTQLNGWQLTTENDIQIIVKEYTFKNFAIPMIFANSISELSEQENHHPRICIEWGKVNLSWWTHSINGLFINDFIMAARCDKTYQLILLN